MASLVRRTARREDEQQSLEIHNAVRPMDAVTMKEVDSFEESTVAYADHLAWLDDKPVGSRFVAVQPQRPRRRSRRRERAAELSPAGLGTALYREVSRWCAARGVQTIEAPVAEDDEASYAYATRRGFVEVERNGRMILDLTALDPAAVDAPPGIEILTWAERPELAEGIYRVAAEVVGYAKFSLTDAQPRIAHHDMTGVRRAWRGRGIAGALKRAQISWAKQQGVQRIATSNELRNAPIRRLNARLGYRPMPGGALMRGPLQLPTD